MSIVIKWTYRSGHIGLPVPPDIAIDRYVQTEMSIAIKMDILVEGISEPIYSDQYPHLYSYGYIGLDISVSIFELVYVERIENRCAGWLFQTDTFRYQTIPSYT
jgi:hypothetical protein